MYESPDLDNGGLASWERQLADRLTRVALTDRDRLLFECGRSRGAAEAARRKGAALVAAGLLLGIGLASASSALSARRSPSAAPLGIVAEVRFGSVRPAKGPGASRRVASLVPNRERSLLTTGWSSEEINNWLASSANVSWPPLVDETKHRPLTAADWVQANP